MVPNGGEAGVTEAGAKCSEIAQSATRQPAIKSIELDNMFLLFIHDSSDSVARVVHLLSDYWVASE